MHVSSLLISFSLHLSFTAAFSPLVHRPSEKSWTPAQETARPGDTNRLGWSPKPTDVPVPGPRYGGMDLLRRAGDFSIGSDTCGFISATTPAPVTCVKPGSYCTDDGAGNMDCCVGDYKECTSTMYSACLDFSASVKGACSGQGPRTICCWSESPSCYTLLMEATASPGKFYSIFQCQVFKGVDTLYASPPSVSITSSKSSSSLSESTSSSTSTSTTASTTTTPRDGENTAPPGGSSSGSSNSSPAPIGAIVGGVVGGVAAIGLIAFLFFFLIIRNRRNNDVIQEGSRPPPTTQNLPPKQPDMAATTVSNPQSAYPSHVAGGPGQGGFPQQQQPQYPSPLGEYKAYDPTQQTPPPQQQPYSPNNTSPYGYYPPSSTNPVVPQTQGFGVSQQPQQQYPHGSYPPPQQPPQPQQQPVVFNELPAQLALGSEGHRAELN